MSLIQEALKRQQGESAEGQPGEDPPPLQDLSGAQPPPDQTDVSGSAPEQVDRSESSQPPPLPVAPARHSPAERGDGGSPAEESVRESTSPTVEQLPAEHGTRAWPILLGILAVILIIVGGFTWGGIYAYQRWKSLAGPLEQHQEKVIPEPDLAVSSEQVSASGEPGVAEPVAELTERESEDFAAEAGEPEVAQIEPPPATVTVAGDKVMAPATIKPAVNWPVLMLSGVVGKGAKGAAFINGEIVDVNESIEGVKVIAIGNQGVKLQYKGEIQFLKVGHSTQ